METCAPTPLHAPAPLHQHPHALAHLHGESVRLREAQGQAWHQGAGGGIECECDGVTCGVTQQASGLRWCHPHPHPYARTEPSSSSTSLTLHVLRQARRGGCMSAGVVEISTAGCDEAVAARILTHKCMLNSPTPSLPLALQWHHSPHQPLAAEGSCQRIQLAGQRWKRS